ncbi:glycosyltransferase [Prevotella sp. kh1p2]|uniref:glycosyltransferase n=1 Tax=Prevotella sp. kh1p2 TaxID=1761883 RepID=UPI0008BF3FE1|nr:glycosyltransferase [Prevotella sp. kh1p2]SET11429.1 Glycosyltransferase involved in cell wall bisynthesis [Prevotella sp. kh1p2]SNU11808.1 Glycosyltransferase involved in cell wall bisynthesis [Prevotellaceae bacterium KH2P17]
MEEKENPVVVAIQCLVYNHEPYLRQCLNGFVMQETDFRFVAIVHDDCSTDGSADIIREYERKYPDIIKPIYEKENKYSKHDGSLRRIVNDAIMATKAKYIAFCEGDDYWTDANKLQIQVNFLESNPQYGLVYTNFNIYNQNLGMQPSPYIKNKPILSFEEHLLRAGYIAPMSWLYRRNLYKYMEYGSKNGYIDVSFAFALEIFKNSRVHYMDKITCVYRILQESASHSKSDKKVFIYKKDLHRERIDFAYRYNVSQEIKIEIDRQYYRKFYKHIFAFGEKRDIKEMKLFFLSYKFTDCKSNLLKILIVTPLLNSLLALIFKKNLKS